MRNVAGRACDARVSARERPYIRVRLMPERHRKKPVPRVAVGTAVMPADELPGVRIGVAALTAILRARVPGRGRIVIALRERLLRRMAARASDVSVRLGDLEAGSLMKLGRDERDGAGPLGIGSVMADRALAREGREVRRLVASLAGGRAHAIEREGMIARRRARRRENVAFGAFETGVPSLEREVGIVVERHRRAEGVLSVAAVARAREPFGVPILVAEEAALLEPEEASFASARREAREHLRAPLLLDVARLAFEEGVRALEVELDVRMTERRLHLRAPGPFADERQSRAAVLLVARRAPRRSIVHERVMEAATFADLGRDLLVTTEATASEPVLVVAGDASVERRQARQLGVRRREPSRHGRVLEEHPTEHGDHDRSENQRCSRVEEHACHSPHKFPKRRATAAW